MAQVTTSPIPKMFRSALRPEQVVEDEDTRRLSASDIAFEAITLPACVLTPRSEADVLALVRVARAEGVSLYPKGGGWSYTAAYLPQTVSSAMVDTRGLQGVHLQREDGVVTVGAGVTWGALDEVLKAHNLRVPSFGPLSGIGATIGASVAQDGGFFGAAGHGAVGEASVHAVSIVDGKGEVRRLTQRDRHDPVVAPQPLAGDCGAFGIKTQLDLRVMERPAATLFASFAFADGDAMIRAMCALVGLPGLGEVYAFDEGIHHNLAATGFSVLETAAIASHLVGARGAWWDRLGGILSTARAGRAFLNEIPWSLHVSVDGSTEVAEETRAEVARRIGGFSGEAIPDVIPRVTRAKPFRAIKALVGPAGERWLSSHGLVETNAAADVLASLQSVFANSAAERRSHGVRSGFLVALLGRRVTVEPQVYWPDSLGFYTRAMAQADQVKRFDTAPANKPGRVLAYQLRNTLIEVMDDHGSGHFQIGRTYAARPGVPVEASAAWVGLKRRFDPGRIMNPSALGL